MDSIEGLIGKREIERILSGELEEHVFGTLWTYFVEAGLMPYEVAQGREADVYQWIEDEIVRRYDDAVTATKNEVL